jgi:hypothetical protein
MVRDAETSWGAWCVHSRRRFLAAPSPPWVPQIWLLQPGLDRGDDRPGVLDAGPPFRGRHVGHLDAAGQKIAFGRTKAERLAAGDPRPSLEERYVDHAAYVSAVTRAAQALKAERFLLDEDVAAATAAAQAASVP